MHLRFLSSGRRGRIKACEKMFEQHSVRTTRAMKDDITGS